MKKIILTMITIVAFIYIFLSFVTAELNPFLWNNSLRKIFICLCIYFFIRYYYDFYYKKISDD